MTEYIYFCSSLPVLHLRDYGKTPLLSSREFLNSASSQLSAVDYQRLCTLDFGRAAQRAAQESSQGSFFARYYSWEVALRNQVMQHRLKKLMGRAREGAAKPRGAGSGSTLLAAAIEQILEQQQPLAVERGLDRLRWAKLDELCSIHSFDMVFLACYFLKLQLLERALLWQKEAGRRFYEEASKRMLQDDVIDGKPGEVR